MCIGGPALIYYVTPTEEELFMVSWWRDEERFQGGRQALTREPNKQKYNPELQRRSLERRKEKQEDFDTFVSKLKGYSKSDKHSKSFLPFSVSGLQHLMAK